MSRDQSQIHCNIKSSLSEQHELTRPPLEAFLGSEMKENREPEMASERCSRRSSTPLCLPNSTSQHRRLRMSTKRALPVMSPLGLAVYRMPAKQYEASRRPVRCSSAHLSQLQESSGALVVMESATLSLRHPLAPGVGNEARSCR